MDAFSGRVAAYRTRVDTVLDRWLPRPEVAPARLHEALRYAVLGEGKRVRPLLVYATGEMLGLEPGSCDPLAAAVELVHAYSLVHDDLPAMDDDDLRRGRPTLHLAYDEATALLVGDALQSLAFEVLATDPACAATAGQRLALVRTLAAASGSDGLVGGQAMDLAGEGRDLDAVDIERIYRLKTGRLIEAAILLPQQLATGLTTEQGEGLTRFADRIGLVFQLRDDLLDLERNTAELGKPRGSDVRNRKATLPAVLGLERARERADALQAEAMAALDAFGEAAGLLRWLAAYIAARNR
jgi:geranylgeranyl pyrophosphate synthase